MVVVDKKIKYKKKTQSAPPIQMHDKFLVNAVVLVTDHTGTVSYPSLFATFVSVIFLLVSPVLCLGQRSSFFYFQNVISFRCYCPQSVRIVTLYSVCVNVSFIIV